MIWDLSRNVPVAFSKPWEPLNETISFATRSKLTLFQNVSIKLPIGFPIGYTHAGPYCAYWTPKDSIGP